MRRGTRQLIYWVGARCLSRALLAAGASLLIYLTIRLAPGSVLDVALGHGGDEEMRAELAAQLGLSQGVLLGYLSWLTHALQGDLGISIAVSAGAPVSEIAARAFMITLSLSAGALALALGLALSLAWILGRPTTKQQLLLSPLQALNSAPSFVLSLCFIHSVNELIHQQLQLGGRIPPVWFPLSKYIELEVSVVPFLFAALLLALGDGLFTDIFINLRAELTTLRESQFIAAVRARGGKPFPHLARNLCLPVLSLYTARLPLVLSAVVIVEYLFTLDGSGYLLLEAARVRDVPLVVGVSLFFTLAVIAVNLLLDLTKALIDPREVAYDG